MKLNIVLDNAEDSGNISGIHHANLKMHEEIYNIQIDIHGDQGLTDTDNAIILAKLEDIFQIMKFMSLNHFYSSLGIKNNKLELLRK
jgi:hypothetical protein